MNRSQKTWAALRVVALCVPDQVAARKACMKPKALLIVDLQPKGYEVGRRTGRGAPAGVGAW